MPNRTNAALNTPVANLAPDGSKVAFVDDDAGDTVRDLDVHGKLLHVIASRLCKPNLQYVLGGGKQLIVAAYPKKQRQAFGDGLGRPECGDPRKHCPYGWVGVPLPSPVGQEHRPHLGSLGSERIAIREFLIAVEPSRPPLQVRWAQAVACSRYERPTAVADPRILVIARRYYSWRSYLRLIVPRQLAAPQLHSTGEPSFGTFWNL